jgi:hypothetical protein
VKLVDEYTRWYLSASRTKLRQDVCCNIVVTDHVMELETVELVLELVDFFAVPGLVDLVDDHCGVAID